MNSFDRAAAVRLLFRIGLQTVGKSVLRVLRAGFDGGHRHLVHARIPVCPDVRPGRIAVCDINGIARFDMPLLVARNAHVMAILRNVLFNDRAVLKGQAVL